jgi:hypothetical protein
MSLRDVSNVVRFPRAGRLAPGEPPSPGTEQPSEPAPAVRTSVWPIVLIYRSGGPITHVVPAGPCEAGERRAMVIVRLKGGTARRQLATRRVYCTCLFFDEHGDCIHCWEASIELALALGVGK